MKKKLIKIGSKLKKRKGNKGSLDCQGVNLTGIGKISLPIVFTSRTDDPLGKW